MTHMSVYLCVVNLCTDHSRKRDRNWPRTKKFYPKKRTTNMETCYELPVTEWRYEEESDSNHGPSSQPIFSRSNNWERQHPSEEKNIYLVSTLVYKETITTHSPLSNIPDIDNGWRLQFVWILHGPIQFPHGWADFFPKNLSTPRTHDSEEKRIGATSWCCYFLNVGTNPYSSDPSP